LTLLQRAVRQRVAPPAARGPAPTADQETDWFVNALLHAGPVDLTRTRLVIFEVSADGVVCAMIPTLRARLAAGAVPAPLRDAIVLDLPPRLGAEHFFALDGHPNALAHQAIGDAILAAIVPSP
jgi:hypothetical protein